MMIVIDIVAYRFVYPPNYDSKQMNEMFDNSHAHPYTSSKDQNSDDDEETDEENEYENENQQHADDNHIHPVGITEALNIDNFLSNATNAGKTRRDRKKFSDDNVAA
jgi:hypothetical protein